MKFLFALFFTRLLIGKSFGYETMIRKGYANCMTCHHSSTGGGLLNAYGKVVASQVSTFSSKSFPKMKVIDQGLQARIAHLRSNGDTRNFPMQFDYLAAFKKEKFSGEFTLAKAPKAQNGEETSFSDEVYVRKMLIGYSPINNFLIQVGRDSLDSGLNLIDHTLFIRKNNKRGVSDFVTLMRGTYFHPRFKASAYFFLPSYQEIEGNEERGLGAEFEKYWTKNKASASLSFIHGKTDNLWRNEITLSGKKSLWIFTLLGQFTSAFREVRLSGQTFKQESSLLKLSAFPLDSLEIYTLAQKAFTSSPFASQVTNMGHGIVWKPYSSISLQYDAKRNTHTNSEYTSIYQLYFNGWFL